MKYLRANKGFKLPLSGPPDMSTIRLPKPVSVGVSAMGLIHIRPKLMVRENDEVRIGTPVFCDKDRPDIQYLSPGAGTVKKVVFGPRRKLIEVVIGMEKDVPQQDEPAVEFESLSEMQLVGASVEMIAGMLQKGGLWQCFRQFPFGGSADESQPPPMIIVELEGNDPFSPHPRFVLEHDTRWFELGLKLLESFTSNIVVVCKESSVSLLSNSAAHVTHSVPDTFPAWDAKALLYQLRSNSQDNSAWTISAQHLILVVKLLLTGRYPVWRMLTVTRDTDKKPHVITRQGAPVMQLIGNMDPSSLITTGRFNGRSVAPETHLGFFDTTLNIINDGPREELFGFVRPGLSKPTVSRAFLSRLFPPDAIEMDCTLHGEERACINCGYCAGICPVDLHPSFIMKSLLGDDIEDALALGLLDCCQCGLCAFVCPSKIEVTRVLSQGMDSHFNDKE